MFKAKWNMPKMHASDAVYRKSSINFRTGKQIPVQYQSESEALYLQSDKKKGKKFRVWDIHWFQRSVRPKMCTLLPFVHAIAGCDTTSPLFGIGKGVPLRKLKSEQIFRKQARVFSEVETKDEVQHAGEETLVCLYGGQPNEGLDKLRYHKYCEKVSTSTSSVQLTKMHMQEDASDLRPVMVSVGVPAAAIPLQWT
ncbi:hypothetical protein HAZT_HAZT002179 [Hyalella azteca]|uniref:Uncharacterized protein n=1 Tax=Hyalella azteca TaxID=294128 RepID=A0A6A0HAG3_HYAAZ|nr:hypothetical protein HAZT_HAZT002179 [Hyalella azteca]